jgi:hypothetical protein
MEDGEWICVMGFAWRDLLCVSALCDYLHGNWTCLVFRDCMSNKRIDKDVRHRAFSKDCARLSIHLIFVIHQRVSHLSS